MFLAFSMGVEIGSARKWNGTLDRWATLTNCTASRSPRSPTGTPASRGCRVASRRVSPAPPRGPVVPARLV